MRRLLTVLCVLMISGQSLSAQQEEPPQENLQRAGGGGGGGDEYPPEIVELAPLSEVSTEYPLLRFGFCDNTSLYSGSLSIVVNSVDYTSSFSWSSPYSHGDCTSPMTSGSANSSSVPLSLGTNTIDVSICDNWDNCAYQTFYVNRTAVGRPSVVLRNHNGDNQSRGLCLTTGAGQSAGLACGDLFVTHSMPGYRTMGRERSFGLIYSSATAAPRPSVAAWVTIPSTIATPTSVYAQLTVSGSNVASATFYPIVAGATGQIVLAFDASSYATGIYPFTLLVRNNYSGGPQDTSLTGELIVVNRSTSEFGPGWWVAGLEQIYKRGTRLLLVSADGSAAVYSLVSSGVWRRAAGGYRDVIHDSGATFVRHLRHGARVRYDPTGIDSAWGGMHLATVSRTGHATTFTWSGSGASRRLVSARVPPGTSGPLYTIAWNGSNLLDSIIDPAGRSLRGYWSNGRLVQLRDPDNYSAHFTYDASNRMTQRRTRRGHETKYVYGNGLRVTRSAIPLSSSDSTITQFEWWDERGLVIGAAGTWQYVADTSNSYSRVLGPRVGVDDNAKFWVDRWGAPVRIQDPLGQVTLVTRGDAYNPALVTRVQSPAGFVRRTTFDTLRARVLTVVDSAVDASGSGTTHDTTKYAYGDSDNPDAPDVVTDPSGIITRYYYNSAGLTERVVSPDSHVTLFTYYTGIQAGLLETAVDSAVQVTTDSTYFNETTMSLTTRIYYNALGNDSITIGPAADTTKLLYDSNQRVRFVTDPLRHRTEYLYEVMGMPAYVYRHIEDQVPGASAIQVANYAYNADGALTSVHDARSVPRSFGYDYANRQTSTTDDYGAVETTYYDRGGLVDSIRTRRNHVIRYRYDAAGRDTMRWWPAESSGSSPGDTVRTQYNAQGLPSRYTNSYGSVRYAYWNNGSIRADSQFRGSTADFVNWYRYDRSGRRTWYFNGLDTISYGYAAVSGNLNAVRINWQGTIPSDSILFTWDAMGRRRTLRYSNGLLMRMQYGAGGNLRYVCATKASSPLQPYEDYQQFEIMVRSTDREGRPTRRLHQWNNACHTGSTGSYFPERSNDSSAFDERDQLRYQSSGSQWKSYEYDVSGNMTRLTTNSYYRDFTVQSGHNRLYQMLYNGVGQLTYIYNDAGDRIQEYPHVTGPVTGLRNVYYNAIGQVTGSQYFAGTTWIDSNLNKCRHDALGRRVNACDPNLQAREGYDGNNLSRTYGAWRIVHGPGLDDPLVGVYVGGATTYRYFFFTEGNGRMIAMTDTVGHNVSGPSVSGATERGHTFAAERAPAAGGMLEGMSYFRNRYYDQATGRWTQEDPIGIAGGINLYGYVGNNPVTFSDPFGLCKEKDDPSCSQGMVDKAGQIIDNLRGQAAALWTKAVGVLSTALDLGTGATTLGTAVTGISATGDQVGPAGQAAAVGMFAIGELNPTHRVGQRAVNKLAADIAQNGIREPLSFVEHNGAKYVVDGNHRLRAAAQAGLQLVPAQQVSLPFRGYRTLADVLEYRP